MKLLSFGWKDDPDTQMICKEIAQSDVSWKVRVFASTLLPLQEVKGATLKILKECAQSDESFIARGCAVGILSEFVNGDPDVLAIVKERAQSDKDRSVRLFSVQMLEEYWKDDLEIQAFLQGL